MGKFNSKNSIKLLHSNHIFFKNYITVDNEFIRSVVSTQKEVHISIAGIEISLSSTSND